MTNCPQCGEAMIGAVNRCWRCGHAVGTATVPPETPSARPSAPTVPETVTTRETPAAARPSPDRAPVRSAALAGLYGAWAAAAVAAAGLWLAPLTAVAAATTAVGLALWGFASPRRGSAAAAAAVGLVILLAAICLAAVDGFVTIFGYGPFDPPPSDAG